MEENFPNLTNKRLALVGAISPASTKALESLFRQKGRVLDGWTMLSQCRLYASAAGVLASPVTEVPLLLSMVFAQHKRLMELEKRIKESLG